MKTVTIRDLRTRLTQVRDSLRGEREALLTAHGRPVAVLIPVDASTVDDTLETLRRAQAPGALRATRRHSREQGLAGTSMADVDRMIAKTRRRRTARPRRRA